MPDSSKASSSAPTPASVSSITEEDLEKLLSREASALNRELEVERILKAFKLNPYEILDIDETAAADQIKKRYRQLSLFIHPDKTSHARAPEAFDLLKKVSPQALIDVSVFNPAQAESELSDEKKREDVDAVVVQARVLLLKENKLPTNTEESDPRLKALDPPFRVQIRIKCKELLIDEEVRRRKAIKMNLANEGLEAQRVEAEQNAKKRKAEADKVWEETREDRVGSWRNFASNKKKKQKTKPNILG